MSIDSTQPDTNALVLPVDNIGELSHKDLSKNARLLHLLSEIDADIEDMEVRITEMEAPKCHTDQFSTY